MNWTHNATVIECRNSSLISFLLNRLQLNLGLLIGLPHYSGLLNCSEARRVPEGQSRAEDNPLIQCKGRMRHFFYRPSVDDEARVRSACSAYNTVVSTRYLSPAHLSIQFTKDMLFHKCQVNMGRTLGCADYRESLITLLCGNHCSSVAGTHLLPYWVDSVWSQGTDCAAACHSVAW